MSEFEKSVQKELDETRRLVRAFGALDASMTEAREKLRTADETNALLDMWIRVLAQTEQTNTLLNDPAWEGRSWEEARIRDQEERKATYQRALDEANRRQSINSVHGRLLAKQASNSSSLGSNNSTPTSMTNTALTHARTGK
ncbi:hypothetical protein BGZ94_009188 [Podila epigama]|nr:hypothetical protein BGZ94_009188 [Podila epigama]